MMRRPGARWTQVTQEIQKSYATEVDLEKVKGRVKGLEGEMRTLRWLVSITLPTLIAAGVALKIWS